MQGLLEQVNENAEFGGKSMKKKLLKVFFMTVLFTAMFSIHVFAAEEEQSQELSQTVEGRYENNGIQEYITVKGNYDFDRSHSFYVEFLVYVDYEWIDGEYGWFNDSYTYDVSFGSNTVHIDNLRLWESDYTENTYYEKYRVYATKVEGYNFNEYIVYMTLHLTVDEWGEVYAGIQFTDN